MTSRTASISFHFDFRGYSKNVINVRPGEGIHHEIIPRLFTKFASRSNSGTGLGLYISKSIVEAPGGRIWAENNSDGIGASIYLLVKISNILRTPRMLRFKKHNIGYLIQFLNFITI